MMNRSVCDTAWVVTKVSAYMRATGMVMIAVMALLSTGVASAQDAVAVDPAHYKVEFENDQVRVLRINYGPHEKSVMHFHPEGVAVFLDDLTGRFTMPGGETADIEVAAGDFMWSDAETHQPENLGDEPFELIQVEFKRAAQDAAAEEVIRASAPAWAATYNSGDAEALAAMYWDDAVLQAPGAPAASGTEAIRDFFSAEIAAVKAAGLTMNIPEAGEVLVSGDLAMEAGTYSVTDASGATVDTGKYIGVFQKRDGEWRYIRDTWNSDVPAATE
jgi:uncharacterized protein (TIGR02246 family)